MFFIQFLLIVLFIGVLAGIVLCFFRKNKEIKQKHIQKIHVIRGIPLFAQYQ